MSHRIATVDDLYNEPGQAELVAGKIVHLPMMGALPGRTKGRILRSLGDYVDCHDLGKVFGGTLAYVVPRLKSGRETFSPDLGYVADDREIAESFILGAPTFAIEVRSASEYARPEFEDERAAKREDYFEAGTLLVWDVDYKGECIFSYHSNDPKRPITFKCGQQADAEPVLPDWRIDVNRIFSKRRRKS